MARDAPDIEVKINPPVYDPGRYNRAMEVLAKAYNRAAVLAGGESAASVLAVPLLERLDRGAGFEYWGELGRTSSLKSIMTWGHEIR